MEEKLEHSAVWYDIFVNGNWVDTHWQQYNTHLLTKNTQNNKMIHNTHNEAYVTIRIHLHKHKNTYTCIYCTKFDKRNGHMSNNSHMISIASNNDRHPVTKTFTPLHYTCRHFTSSNLNFTQLHFTTFRYPLIWLNPI